LIGGSSPWILLALAADVCVEALNEALARFGQPEIMNADQGSQFTSSPGPTGCAKRASGSRWTAKGAVAEIASWITL